MFFTVLQPLRPPANAQKKKGNEKWMQSLEKKLLDFGARMMEGKLHSSCLSCSSRHHAGSWKEGRYGGGGNALYE